MQKYTNDSLYSTIQIAKALQVSRITVFRYIMEGKLKVIKMGEAMASQKVHIMNSNLSASLLINNEQQ